MWDLLFKFIDGDTVDTVKYVPDTKTPKDTQPSQETLDVLNQLVEERALFTESILEQLEHIDNILNGVLNKTE